MQGISDLITVPGLIQLGLRRRAGDYDRCRFRPHGHRPGLRRKIGPLRLPQQAISSPLLEASIDGAKGILLSIAGSSDLGLFEVNEAAEAVAQAAAPEANIIFGAVIDESLGDTIRVTVIATGFDAPSARDNLRITKELDVRPFTDAPIDIPAFLRRGK